jgi:hydrogenase maturation protease
MEGKVLVACVGNIFLGDDGFGVEVAQQLAKSRLPEHVVVKDFGIRSYDLAYALMERWDLTILVDALPHGGKPGTVYVIEPDTASTVDSEASLDAHSMNPVSAMRLVNALGGKPGRMLVVGCEPEKLDADDGGQFGLSDPVKAAISEAVSVIMELAGNNTQATAA